MQNPVFRKGQKYLKLVPLICLLSAQLVVIQKSDAQTIPALGTDSTLDVANWNVEWLGSTTNGPSNERTQLSNALKILKNTNMDLWGLCEISSAPAWDSLLKNMPEFDGAISTWDQTQKTALLFRKSIFRKLYQQHILAIYDREFASGRLPLEVALECSIGGRTDTLYVIVIHLKANTGSTAEKNEAWDLRKRSSEALKTYMDQRKNRKFMVIGDWNDDVDVSIWNNLATPFSRLKGDTGTYFFPSAALSAAGQRSTTSFTQMIDHQLVNKPMRHYYITGSAAVFYASNYITGFGSNTSDHYPVYSRFDLRRNPPAATVSTIRLSAEISWNGQTWQTSSGLSVIACRFYTTGGHLLYEGLPNLHSPLPGQVLIGEWILSDGRLIRRLLF